MEYYVTLLELDGHEVNRGEFKTFEQTCKTAYLHRGDQTLGRIHADDKTVTVYGDQTDNGAMQIYDRKDFEAIYAKNGDLKYCKKVYKPK